MGQEQDDHTLMRAVAARDPSALKALYDRHAGLMFALCLRVLKDRSEAEDVLISVFWEVWDRSARYDAARGGPLSYLLGVTRSRAVDRLRALKRHGHAPPEAGTDPDKVMPPGRGPRPGDPAQAVEAREMAVRVRRALSELKPPERESVEMAFFDAMSHAQIAERIGAPLGTVKARIRNGLIHLREALRGTSDAGGGR